MTSMIRQVAQCLSFILVMLYVIIVALLSPLLIPFILIARSGKREVING